MRAVLDTVIFVRALINPKGRWGRLLFDLSDRYEIVLSPDIIKEIVEVVYRPSLQARYPEMADPIRLDAVLAKLEEAEVVEPAERVAICRDPSDDKLFECAVAGAADYIISEDKDVLAVGDYQDVQTISAQDFMDTVSDL
jgi:putative PIN family toxin of toxin-antitoxin system